MGGKYGKEDYSFVCGYMAARDKYLLTRERADRMIESRTAEDAMRVLSEMDYTDEGESVPAGEFESLLSRESEKTYAQILPFVPDRSYFEFFLYPSDYHNVKTLLKAEALGTDPDEFLMETGTIPPGSLGDMVRGRDYDGMRAEMAAGIKEALEEYGVTRDPQAIDMILDKACYRDMSLLASGTGSDFIKGYIALRIDLINICSFARVREMEKGAGFFKKVFIEGGSVPAAFFEGVFEAPREQAADSISSYGLRCVPADGLKAALAPGRVTALEKLCDNALTAYMSEAKYVVYGIEPLIARIAAKENEIKTVRIIMAGKLAGIPTEQIRQRIRKTYA